MAARSRRHHFREGRGELDVLERATGSVLTRVGHADAGDAASAVAFGSWFHQGQICVTPLAGFQPELKILPRQADSIMNFGASAFMASSSRLPSWLYMNRYIASGAG
jgi:hypothetical protein